MYHCNLSCFSPTTGQVEQASRSITPSHSHALIDCLSCDSVINIVTSSSLALASAIMDTVPHISAAGYKPPTDHNSTASCVQPDLDPHTLSQLNATLSSFTLHAASDTAPDTLAAIDPHYKYRRTFQTQPGLRFIHPGLTHQTTHNQLAAHGITTKQTLTAADVLASASASAASSPLARFIHQQKEATYASNRMAPLGASLVRGHVLPAATQADEFRFGVSTRRSDDAKQLIYAPTPTPPTATAEEKTLAATSTGYYTTHRQASTKALTRSEERQITRPVDRHYDWSTTAPHVDPDRFTFGLPPPVSETQQVKRALTFEPEEKETVVMSVAVEEHDRRKSRVGEVRVISDEKVRALHADPSFRFGLSGERDEWDAKQTLKGSYSAAEQQPDADLGTTQRRTGRHDEQKPAVDDTRKFGLPSIRHDRTPPAQKSVANIMNYGDEGSSKQLLYPPPYASFGLQDEHWLQERPAAELRALYERMGVRMKDRQWEVICRRAVALYGALSVDSVRHAINRQEMERACAVCGAIQCQHADCIHRMCSHDGLEGLGNHRRFMAHPKVSMPLRQPAGATATGYTPVGEKAVSR